MSVLPVADDPPERISTRVQKRPSQIDPKGAVHEA